MDGSTYYFKSTPVICSTFVGYYFDIYSSRIRLILTTTKPSNKAYRMRLSGGNSLIYIKINKFDIISRTIYWYTGNKLNKLVKNKWFWLQIEPA